MTLATLIAALTAAILALSPAVGPERAGELASGAAEAAQDQVGHELEAGLLLVVVARYESDFREEIQNCQCEAWECDGGKAASLYQLHRQHFHGFTKAEVCESHPLASRLALRALSGHKTAHGAIAAYLGRKPTDPEVVRRLAAYERLLRHARE